MLLGSRAEPGLLLAILASGACARPTPLAAPGTIVREMRERAGRLAPLVRARWVCDFLHATAQLPPISPRALRCDPDDPRRCQVGAGPAPAGERLRLRTVDEEFYYYGRYGTPLAYARALDVLAESGVERIAGKRVLDFGCGPIGAPRLLATIGADVTCVEVSEEMAALYRAPGDQGPGGAGRVRWLLGRFPADAAVRQAVGGDYDIILAKNVLKRGFLHPERPVPERQRLRLGVDGAAFVAALGAILRPGGRLLIYNLHPAQNPPDRPYIPWADGRCPFPAELFAQAGLRVLVLDRDDTPAARALGRALGWDQRDPRHPEDPPMDLQRDLFAHYSLIGKP